MTLSYTRKAFVKSSSLIFRPIFRFYRKGSFARPIFEKTALIFLYFAHRDDHQVGYRFMSGHDQIITELRNPIAVSGNPKADA